MPHNEPCWLSSRLRPAVCVGRTPTPLVALLICLLPLAASGYSSPPPRLRVVVSEDMVGADIDEIDARSAMQAWSGALVKQSGFPMDLHVSKHAALVNEVRGHQVDAFMLTTLEFLEVARYSSPSGVPRDYAGRVTLRNKLAPAVLPVFFRQVDACLVTRRGFTTMCELNPQLGRNLRVIATSPALVAALIGFHKDCSPENRQKYQSAVLDLQKTASGRQALTIFEYTRVLAADSGGLHNGTQLAREHERIRK